MKALTLAHLLDEIGDTAVEGGADIFYSSAAVMRKQEAIIAYMQRELDRLRLILPEPEPTR